MISNELGRVVREDKPTDQKYLLQFPKIWTGVKFLVKSLP